MLSLFPALLLPGACQSPPPPAALAVGMQFPAFELSDLQQQHRTSAEFLGAPQLVNFWATWCPPCREEMTGLQALHHALAQDGGGVVAISIDHDANLVREFVLKLGITYPILLDPQQHLAARQLSIRSYPTSFLLRRGGQLAEVVVGARPWETPEQIAAVRARLL